MDDLENIVERIRVNGLTEQDENQLRKYKTSSVSYVPEEVRRLPEELRALIAQQVWGAAKDAFEISAQKVEAALASAPADANNANVTCECERGPREIVENTDEGGTKWWTLATHCTDCLESASAPTDGREYE